MKLAQFILVLAPQWAVAQCTLTATVTSRPECSIAALGGQPGYATSVIMLNGTPPFTYTWSGGGSPIVSSSNTSTKAEPHSCSGSSSWGVSVMDAAGCTYSSGPIVPVGLYGLSILTPLTLTQELLPVDSNNTCTYRLGDPGSQYCAFQAAQAGRMADLPYSLIRNGALYQSGFAQSIFVNGPGALRLEIPGLPVGSYTLGFASSSSNWQQGTTLWCQSIYPPARSFYVPRPADLGVNVRVAGALAGALPTGTVMSDWLRSMGLLPATEPYSALGYTYIGTSSGGAISPFVLAVTGTEAVVDWVVVELRSPTAPYGVLASRPALIRRDGEVIDLDGDPYVNFPGLAAGSYRIALRHRNHLGVMTSAPLSLGFIPERANFRAGGAYGTSPLKNIGGVQCLWPGDVTFDGTVKYAGGSNDRDPILTLIGGTTPTSTLNNVYNGADLNLDGSVKYAGSANDRDIILQTIGGSVPTATRIQQLP